jgi:hypothetical protein
MRRLTQFVRERQPRSPQTSSPRLLYMAISDIAGDAVSIAIRRAPSPPAGAIGFGRKQPDNDPIHSR